MVEAYEDQIQLMLKISKQMDEIIDKDSGQTHQQDLFTDLDNLNHLDFEHSKHSETEISHRNDICLNDFGIQIDVCLIWNKQF